MIKGKFDNFEELAQHMTRPELAAHYGCHVNTITRKYKEYQIDAFITPKLDSDQLREKAQVMTTYQLAAHFKVHFRTILNYKRRLGLKDTFSQRTAPIRKPKPITAKPRPIPPRRKPKPIKTIPYQIYDKPRWNPIIYGKIEGNNECDM